MRKYLLEHYASFTSFAWLVQDGWWKSTETDAMTNDVPNFRFFFGDLNLYLPNKQFERIFRQKSYFLEERMAAPSL